MATYALVDSSGLIVNLIVLDDPAQWEVPEGHTLVEDTWTAPEGVDEAIGKPMEIGGTYLDGVYTPPPAQEVEPLPPPPPPEPQPETTVLYDHENRLRLLEGQPPLTLQDFFTKMRP